MGSLETLFDKIVWSTVVALVLCLPQFCAISTFSKKKCTPLLCFVIFASFVLHFAATL